MDSMPRRVAGWSFGQMQNLNVSDSMCQWIPKALSKVESLKDRSRAFGSVARSDDGILSSTVLLLHTKHIKEIGVQRTGILG